MAEIDLPWSNNKDLNILVPCKLCSNDSISAGHGLCRDCMIREALTEAILKSSES